MACVGATHTLVRPWCAASETLGLPSGEGCSVLVLAAGHALKTGAQHQCFDLRV